MAVSETVGNKILEHLVGKTEYPLPTAFLGVSTSDPSVAITEPSGGSYSRVQTSGSDWSSAAGKMISNATQIEFTRATGNWGTLTYGVLFDSLTDGNAITFGELGSSQAINAGDKLQVPAGDLPFSIV